MATVGDRIKEVIELQGFNTKNFCKEFAINYTGLTMIINGDRPLGMGVLNQLKAAIPELDTEWLLYGTVREEVSKSANYESSQKISEPTIAAEPVAEYLATDPVETMFLQYLDKASVQEKIKKIFNQ